MALTKAVDTEKLDWLYEYVQMVVWAEEPRDQVAANLFLFIVALVSSFVTLGATLVLAAIFFFFGTLGAVRLVLEVLQNSLNG